MSYLQEESRSLQNDLIDGITDHDKSIMSSAQKTYLESNNSNKHLFLMCFRLSEGGTPAFDLVANKPWHSIKKQGFNPARIECAEETCWQSKMTFSAIDHVHHKPAYWSRTKCIEWLQVHPVVDPLDILFLKKDVTNRVKDIILNAQQDQQEEARQAGGQWRGRIPFVRLFLCCLAQDDIKSAYLWRADVWTRHDLDARNLVEQPRTAFELISDRWNNKIFNPVAPTSECHVIST